MTWGQRLHRWIWPQRGERLKAAVIYGLVGTLITAAVLLTALRLLLAAAPSLIAPVESMVSDRFAVPVRIGELDARLHRLRPGLVLRDVLIGDPDADQPPLRFDSMTLAVAPWESLRSASLRLNALEVSGLDITVRWQVDGWQISGMLPLGGQGGVSSVLEALRGLPVDHLLVRDSRLHLQSADPELSVSLTPATLRWRREPEGDWRFALDARDQMGDAQIQARLHVPAGEPVIGHGFVNAQALPGQWFSPFIGQPALEPATTAKVSARLWLTLDAGGLERLTAQVEAVDLGWLNGGVSDLELLGRVDRTADGWRGRIIPQRFAGPQAPVQMPGPVAIGYDSGPKHWRWALEDWPLSLARHWLPAALNADNEVLLSGAVESLSGVWADPLTWRVQAALSKAQWRSTGLVDVLDAQRVAVRAGPGGGVADVRGLAMVSDPDTLLRRPISLEQGSGRVQWWSPEVGEWRLRLSRAQALWQGSPLSLSASYFKSTDRDGLVDLSAELGTVDIATVMQHLPTGIMHERLVAWLDQAVQTGRMERLSLRFLGDPMDFPFSEDAGLFDLRLGLADIGFQFNQQWPALEGTSAQLQFLNRGLRIEASGGQIAEVPLSAASAAIENLWRPRLRVDARLDGALESMHGLLRASPLLRSGGPLSRLRPSGTASVDLALYFPFERRPMELEGQVRLADARVAMEQPAIALSQINGVVGFDGNGLRWQGLRGRFSGQPFVSDARSFRDDGRARIEINANTRVALSDWPGLQGLADQSNGQAAWRVSWQGPGFAQGQVGQGQAELSIRSSLEGIALRLPFGLDKSADSALATRLDWSWLGDGAERVRLRYGDRLGALIERSSQGQTGATLQFGSADPASTRPGRTHVAGTLPGMRLGQLGAAFGGNGGGSGFGLPPLSSLDVTLDSVDIARWRVAPIRVRGERSDDNWRLSLSEAADGQLQWMAADQSVDIQLERLSVTTLSAEQRSEMAESQPSAVDHQAAGPDVTVTASQLLIDGVALGRLDFSRVNEGTDQAAARLNLVGPSLDLNALINTAEDEPGAHRLRFDMDTDDAGQLLRALALPRAMVGGIGSVSGHLDWIGPLLSPRLPSLGGELRVDLRNGSLPAVEPGAGRALGLFSLSVLPRRLGLDFSDVVGEGLVFDALQGSWQTQAGRMRTDDLRLRGPSLDLALRGETDLVRQRYDQRVTVTPHISSALTFLGGLAGGPAAAVMLFLTRDMIEPGVERLTEFQYRIVGPWDDPQFELLTSISDGDDQEDAQ